MGRVAGFRVRGGLGGGSSLDDSNYFADLLWFESLALEELYGGRVGLSLTPYIGLYKIGFLEETKVLIRFIHGGSMNIVREVGDEVAVYLLHYGDYVKVGSSSVTNVVSRMFSQAPLCGVVATSLIFKERANSEEVLDRYLVKRAKGILGSRSVGIRYKKRSIRVLVDKIVRDAPDPEKLINNLVDMSNSLYDLLWDENVLHRCEPLLPSSRYWFTASISEEDVELLKRLRSSGATYGVPSKLKHRSESVKGTLLIFRNALCAVSLENKTYVDYCDKISRNMLFEVV